MTELTVQASRNYSIRIEDGLLRRAGEQIREICGLCTAVIVSDDRVYPLYGGILKTALEDAGFAVKTFVFPNGEKSKNLKTYGELQEFLCEQHITRKDLIAALGGGVVGDLAGFAAATYQRGIRFVQIPTTWLACVDSSVGGKTAVDLAAGKNQVGCFYQPSLVLIDPETLATLPEEQYRCGCAEIIKYAVIGSRDFFEELKETEIREMPEKVISTCAGMKRDIVERDEFDTGERMLLNFGHTFGHAAEFCSHFTVLHGQAVAMGMAVMTRAAAKFGCCSPETAEEVEAILKQYRLPVTVPYSLAEMRQAVLNDKKMSGSEMRIVVPERIGRCRILTIPAENLPEWMKEGGIQ